MFGVEETYSSCGGGPVFPPFFFSSHVKFGLRYQEDDLNDEFPYTQTESLMHVTPVFSNTTLGAKDLEMPNL